MREKQNLRENKANSEDEERDHFPAREARKIVPKEK
jgi:hypothetical protein